jgi:hypothetical protein
MALAGLLQVSVLLLRAIRGEKQVWNLRPGWLYAPGYTLMAAGGVEWLIPYARYAGSSAISSGALGVVLAAIIHLGIMTSRAVRGDISAHQFVTVRGSLYVFVLVFPPLLVGLATSGKGFAFDAFGSGHGWLPPLAGATESLLLMLIVLFLAVIPDQLCRNLTWDSVSQQAKDLLPAWLAACAAASTGFFVFMLHFGGAQLAQAPLGGTGIAALGVMALLWPLYQWIAKAFWNPGIEMVLSPVRWRAAWANEVISAK